MAHDLRADLVSFSFRLISDLSDPQGFVPALSCLPRHHAAAVLRKNSNRLKLETGLAMPIFVVARAMPMVLTNSSMRSFCSAKTCSTRARIFDLAALARRIAPGMGLPLGFLRWTWDRKPFLSMKASLAAER